MRILVLGAAAGGGYPQWNCNCSTCRQAWQGDAQARPRTQSSLAVSADGARWVLLNASPDLRQQILQNRALWPAQPGRHSPIASVVLTNADVDHVAGLLSLRERQSFSLYADPRVHATLRANAIFNVLSDLVARRDLAIERPVDVLDGAGAPLGLRITAFAVPGKVALYLEDEKAGLHFGTQEGDTIGLEVAADAKRFFYLPACAALPQALADRLRNAELVFFDGTLWRDDEMATHNVGAKTGQRMGHMSLSGDNGTLAAFAALGVRRKVLVHINNTNPVLLAQSPEHREVRAAGWDVAEDGMEIVL
jgi:pyrroloquinoline quinone biosynthesis protein B